MSILSKSAILAERGKGNIVIEPFYPEQLGASGYDLHLGANMYMLRKDVAIDPKKDVSQFYEAFHINEYAILKPNTLYLGVTVEYTEAHGFVPVMEGKSSLGREGIASHWCAGMGDVGFCGHWTLEIVVINPTIVYAGMPIGQLIWNTVEGDIEDSYRDTGSYNTAASKDPWPVLPNLWKKQHQFLQI